MKRRLAALVILTLALYLGEFPMAKSEDANLPAAEAPGDLSGAGDFDFLMGDWRVHHRVNKAGPGAPWTEFEGDCTERPLMGGLANVEEHRFERSTGISYGVGTFYSDVEIDGKTWETNWIMEFRRAGAPAA